MPTLILARLVLLEARRGGLPWLGALCIAAAFAAAAFLSQVALTESISLGAAVAGALLRAGAVFLVVAHVAASAQRESQDKGFELSLALPLSRTRLYAGRLAGHALVAMLLAAAFSIPLLAWCAPAAVAAWGLSLAAEAAMAAAIAFFFAMSLTQLVPAIAAGLGLYLLARAMPAVQLIADGPLAGESASAAAARWIADAIALLLPPVQAATRTEWLLYGAPALPEYAGAVAGLLVYGALAAVAGLVDFHRRNL